MNKTKVKERLSKLMGEGTVLFRYPQTGELNATRIAEYIINEMNVCIALNTCQMDCDPCHQIETWVAEFVFEWERKVTRERVRGFLIFKHDLHPYAVGEYIREFEHQESDECWQRFFGDEAQPYVAVKADFDLYWTFENEGMEDINTPDDRKHELKEMTKMSEDLQGVAPEDVWAAIG